MIFFYHNQLTVWSIKHQTTAENKFTPSMSFLKPPKYFWSKEKQQILTFEKLQPPKKNHLFFQVIRGRFSTKNNSLSTN